MLYLMTSVFNNLELVEKLFAKCGGTHDFSAQIDLKYNLDDLDDQILVLAALMNYKNTEVVGVKADEKQVMLLQLEFADLELQVARLPLSKENRQLLIGYIANHNHATDFVRHHRNMHEAVINLYQSYHSAVEQEPDTVDDFDDLIERLRAFAYSYILDGQYYESKLKGIIQPLGKS